METKGLSRRGFLRVGMTTAGVLAGTSTVANVCSNNPTAAQGLGPFFPRAGTPVDPIQEEPGQPIFLANDNDLTVVRGRTGRAQGQIVYVRGEVRNSQCQPVAGATVIIWQASQTGRYNHLGDTENHSFPDPRNGQTVKREHDARFQYWGRATTDQQGRYLFKTIVPGFYPAQLASNPQDSWYRPPHIHFMVSARGRQQFVTQMYFRGEEIVDNAWIQELNQRDLLLRNPDLTPEEQEQLIVNFAPALEAAFADGLVGDFSIKLP